MEIFSRRGAEQELGRIGFSEEQADIITVATNFCRDKSPMEKVRSLLTEENGYDAAVWQEIADLGWLAMAIPEEHGGLGLGIAEIVPVMEQMGRYMLTTPFMAATLAAQALSKAGSLQQQAELLPQIAAGAVITLGLMETEGHLDYAKLSATATRHGENIALSGQKNFVAYAAQAEAILVSVLLDDRPALVIIKTSEIAEKALRRESVIDETNRSYTLTLDGISVTADAVLDQDATPAALLHVQYVASLLSAAETCGGTQSVIDYTIDYLKTRKQFGKLIGAYQSLQHPIVDAFVQYEQARSHLYSAAHCFNEQGTGEVATHMARAQADAVLSYAADRSIQFHGGFGFTYDCDAQLYRRRAIWHAALYGDATYHKKRLAELLF